MTDPREEILQHLSAMRAFAMSLTHNQTLADDVVQDAVIKAWTNFDKFRPGTNLRAWLFTILRNTFYSLRRKHKNEVEDVDGDFADALAIKPDHDGRLQMRDFLEEFQKLPVDQREALMLVGASGFSYDEAAEMCGVPVGTIKSRANRARQQLAKRLGMHSGDSLDLTDAPTTAVLSRLGQSAV
ncbi:MAG: RNA polymerase sigma factor [Pseudomonadota bacterium]